MARDYINRIGSEKRERILRVVNTEVIMREAYLRAGFSARELCEKHEVDPRDLSAVMGLFFGESFSSLLRRLRVNKVCKMLESQSESGKSCETVGLRCGFASRQSFYNAFVSLKGVTPFEYRNKCLKNK